VIEVRFLRKEYDETVAIENLHLDVPTSEVFGLLALMLFAGCLGLVQPLESRSGAPLAFHRPANPAWLAAASPVYHIDRWFKETPTDASEFLLLLGVFSVLFVGSACRFHFQLRRLMAGVDRTLVQMGYSQAAVLPN
jgi:hypothetical protein